MPRTALAGLAAGSILALTVGLSLARPRLGHMRINPAGAATLGAGSVLLLRLLPASQALHLLAFLAAPLATIASLMVLTAVADRAGLFQRLSYGVARAARGDARRLLTYVFLFGVALATVVTNDAAILILTPMVWRLVQDVGAEWSWRQKLPYYFGVVYVATVVGLLPISNPVNLILSQWVGIGFLEHARTMLLPATASVVLTLVWLRVLFRKDLPRSYRVPRRPPPVPDRSLFAGSVIVLGCTLVGLLTHRVTGLAPVHVAVAGAAAALILHRVRRTGTAALVAHGVGWDALVFVTGMFLIAAGLRAGSLTAALGDLLTTAQTAGPWSGSTVSGFLTAATSALLNNHPVADTMALTIRDLPVSAGAARHLAFAALIGADVGPRMLPIGSLAALLWFRLLRERGTEIPYRLFVRLGLPLALATIALSLAVLNLQTLWLG